MENTFFVIRLHIMKHLRYLFIPLLFLNSIMASENNYARLGDVHNHKTIEYSSEEDEVDLVIRPSLSEQRKSNCLVMVRAKNLHVNFVVHLFLPLS